MKRFAIWDKKSPVIAISGKVYTADEWIKEHPSHGLENITAVLSTSEVNGEFNFTLGQLESLYGRGCDFSKCTTAEEKLEVIEAYLDAKEIAEAEAIAEEKARADMQADSLVSIAASLEYQNMMTLPDVEG